MRLDLIVRTNTPALVQVVATCPICHTDYVSPASLSTSRAVDGFSDSGFAFHVISCWEDSQAKLIEPGRRAVRGREVEATP